MATLNEALISLNKGKGKGSHRINSGGKKIHLCYVESMSEYFTVELGEQRQDLTAEDIDAENWVVEE